MPSLQSLLDFEGFEKQLVVNTYVKEALVSVLKYIFLFLFDSINYF